MPGHPQQTWEYSSQYALRSYLYLLLHAPAAAAGALLRGPHGALRRRGSRARSAAGVHCLARAPAPALLLAGAAWGLQRLRWLPKRPHPRSLLHVRPGPSTPTLIPPTHLLARAAKLAGFYCLRACLGLASAASEAWLYRAVAARYRPAVARCLLLFLASAAGLFAASTAMLPSTFTMYAMTAAAAAVLEGRPYVTIAAAVIGEARRWLKVGLLMLGGRASAEAPARAIGLTACPCCPCPRCLQAWCGAGAWQAPPSSLTLCGCWRRRRWCPRSPRWRCGWPPRWARWCWWTATTTAPGRCVWCCGCGCGCRPLLLLRMWLLRLLQLPCWLCDLEWAVSRLGQQAGHAPSCSSGGGRTLRLSAAPLACAACLDRGNRSHVHTPAPLQASLWNFVRYNVVGGGDSALYGIEPPSYYLRNGLNQLGPLLPLALALPALAAAAGGASLCTAVPAAPGARRGAGTVPRGALARLLLAVSPAYVWLALITALPHKEERFLYVVYPLVRLALGSRACSPIKLLLDAIVDWATLALPTSSGRPLCNCTQHNLTPALPQICLAAAASFVALCSLAGGLLRAALPRRAAALLVQAAAAAFLAGSVLLAASRSAALVINYGAPMRLYRHLPQARSCTLLGWLLHEWRRLGGAGRGLAGRWPLPQAALPEARGVACPLAATQPPAQPNPRCLMSTAPLPPPPTQAPDAGGPRLPVCVGAEWHRFPSAFHLPEPYRLQVGWLTHRLQAAAGPAACRLRPAACGGSGQALLRDAAACPLLLTRLCPPLTLNASPLSSSSRRSPACCHAHTTPARCALEGLARCRPAARGAVPAAGGGGGSRPRWSAAELRAARALPLPTRRAARGLRPRTSTTATARSRPTAGPPPRAAPTWRACATRAQAGS